MSQVGNTASRIEMHHLLECILFPMSDGTLKHIRNERVFLNSLGIYKPNVMVIPVTKSEHNIMHRNFENLCGYNRMSGKKHSDETKKLMSEHSSHYWKGKKPWNYGRYTSTSRKEVLRRARREEKRRNAAG